MSDNISTVSGDLKEKVDLTEIKLLVIDNFVWILCVAIYILFVILTPTGFIRWTNIESILYVSSMLGFLVLGEAIILLTGNLDLSLAQNAGLSVMVAGHLLLYNDWMSGWLGIAIVLGVATVLGMVNGLMVGGFGLNAFLATLVTYITYDWATFLIRRASIVDLPKSFFITDSSIGGVHIAIPIFITIAVLTHIVLTRTRFGVHVYSVGGNPETTRMMGINVSTTLFWSFTIAGTFAGISGLMYVGYMSTVATTVAQGQIFNAFAGAIIGGISLKGGRGRVLGALGGVILLGILDAGLTMLAVSPEIRGILTGIVLLAAIVINLVMENLRDRILMPS